MPEPPARALRPGTHLVLYDGVCGLCNRLLQFLLRYDHQGVFVFAPLQSATGRVVVARCGGDPDDLTTIYVVANYQTPKENFITRARAALFLARALGWPWKAAAVFSVLPEMVLNRLYDFVATHRYRVFGQREQCLVPRPEDRERFVDS